MNSSKFVYFDVGGVSIIDFSGNDKWTEMKRSFGVTKENEKHFDLVWEKYEDRICINCDIDTVISEFRQVKGISMPDDYSMLADFVERFERNSSIWPVIHAVKEHYGIGLLTNMYPRMLNAIIERKLIPDLEWNAIVDSSVAGYQKPHPSIYQKAEEVAKLKPEEIFFIDNSEENVKEANRRGWKTFLYDPRNPEASSKKLSKLLDLNV